MAIVIGYEVPVQEFEDRFVCCSCRDSGKVLRGVKLEPITAAQAYARDLDQSCAICCDHIPPRVPFA